MQPNIELNQVITCILAEFRHSGESQIITARRSMCGSVDIEHIVMTGK